jgi:hypothetical protein
VETWVFEQTTETTPSEKYAAELEIPTFDWSQTKAK